MSAVLYEVEFNGKTVVARTKKGALRIAKDVAEMEHIHATVIATTLKTGREVRTEFPAK